MFYVYNIFHFIVGIKYKFFECFVIFIVKIVNHCESRASFKNIEHQPRDIISHCFLHYSFL